ncbi:LacI family DNA-binding transcriptional regulator [Microbacterium sp. B2969]|uniref:LacI family DNA-binding transcriptional regulator n=1 Tax=Microbacterium alkaliflavum TaxID=3248839 RepID=A0ABW7QCK3_9MICO
MPDPTPARAGRARISDVAAAAGVSVTTVSHALSGARTVNPQTRERILEIAAALGYAPDRIASGLRRKRTGVIGFLGDHVATTPFAGRMIAGARDAGLEHDVLLLVAESEGDEAVEQALVDRFVAQRVDGLLIARMYHQRVKRPTAPADLPIVLLDAAPERGWKVDAVVPDEAQITRLACEAVLAAGHRAIAYADTLDRSRAARGRHLGVRAALGDAGVQLGADRIAAAESDARGGRAAGAALLDRADRPTAVICFNDRIAMGVMQAAARLGLSVPRDVSVVGIDDLRPVADGLDPGLTTAALPHAEMGDWAMTRLIARVGKTEPAPPRLHLMPGWLVERGSVAPPAA